MLNHIPLPNKEDVKCFIFIAVMIFLIALATFYYYYVIRFVLFVVFYWYISIPIIVICFSSFDFISNRILIKKACDAVNTAEIQEYFKNSSGENPLKDGKPTKSYKKWLIQKIATPKYKVKTKVRFSPSDIKGLIILIILLIVILIAFLAIYQAIFPDYRVPMVW
ncbi:MAG: hypothetical protein ACFE9I_04870 [Candidatus Hermodarchaeota archaeon]